MVIKISKADDELLIREFAAKHNIPCTKAVIKAVQMAEDIHLMQGKVATYQFMLKAMREEYSKKNPLRI